jgi:hypothetical protein
MSLETAPQRRFARIWLEISSKEACNCRTGLLFIGSAYRNKALPSVIALPAGSAALLEGVHPAVVMPKNIVTRSIAIRLFFSQDFNNLSME